MKFTELFRDEIKMFAKLRSNGVLISWRMCDAPCQHCGNLTEWYISSLNTNCCSEECLKNIMTDSTSAMLVLGEKMG